VSGFPLTGVDPSDPIPGTKIEIRFEQGQGTGAAGARRVVFLGQKDGDGSETVDTLGDLIADDADCVARFGLKSEIRTMYRLYAAVDPSAEIYAIAVSAGAGTASARTLTFVNAATAATTFVLEWAGDPLEVTIESGDAIATIAANVAAAINDRIDWPFSASAALGVVTLTVESPLGPRGDFTLAGIRVFFRKNVTTTATLSAISSGATDDDQTTALGLLATRDIYYQINAKSPTSAPTSSDNGVGEHAAQITANALPAKGIRNQMFWAFTGQSSGVATVATAVNNVRAQMCWAQGTSWTPAMLAAHYAAVVRSKQIAHPAARLTDYGLGATDVFTVPKPYDSADLPTEAEIRSALNNGGSVINWTPTGTPYIVRQITTRSLNGTANDYRARSGHIPSALDHAAAFIADEVGSVAKDFVADDPVEGSTPLENVTYPNQVRRDVQTAIGNLVSFGGGPILDPGVLEQMLASVEVRRLVNGTSVRMALQAVKHNDKKQYLILETSTGV
jgi:phage tail sheath gpL-like